MFDNTPFTNEEMMMFKSRIQEIQNGSLHAYKEYDRCIAIALCYIGSHRRKPICGSYVSDIRDILTKVVRHEFTKEEMELIILACIKNENDGNPSDSILPKEIVNRLSCLVPVFMSRRKRLIDYLDD